MTPKTLFESLQPICDDLPVIFRMPDHEISGGYHITELTHAPVTAIDCCGRVRRRQESTLQILEGGADAPITVGRLLRILSQSMEALPDLGEAPLHAQMPDATGALMLCNLAAPVRQGALVSIVLSARHAVCQPAAEQLCCGSGARACA